MAATHNQGNNGAEDGQQDDATQAIYDLLKERNAVLKQRNCSVSLG